MIRLPELPDGFTPAFLSDILHQHGCLAPEAQVSSVQLHQVGDGTGMMAELAQLRVEYNAGAAKAPHGFIAKFASRNKTNRDIALSYNLYERETRFISELSAQAGMRIPIAYFSGRDEDRFLILMEDMTDYAVGSQVEGATLTQTEQALDELAKLHSAFWNRVESLDWVPHISNSYHATNMHQLAVLGADGLMQKFGPNLSAQYVDLRAAFLESIPTLQAQMDTTPTTLCHGDFRMENLLYGCNPGHAPVAVIDWQGPLRARGMSDVALFLGQSTKTEVRRAHERDLLARYVRGLQAGGVTGLDLGAVWQEYRRSVLYSWVYVTVVAGTLDSSNEKAHRWMSQMVARQSAISADLRVFDLLP